MNEAIYLTRTGICTTDLTVRSAEDMFSTISNMGYKAVQFGFSTVMDTMYTADGNIEIPDCGEMKKAAPYAIDNIRAAADKYGIDIPAVNGTFNMAHPESGVRLEGLGRFEGFAAASRELGARIITLCSGTRCRTHLWTNDPSNDTDEAWRDMIDSMKRAAEIAEKYEMTLAVETEVSNIVSSPEKARRMMDEVGSPRLKMILDAANLFPAGTAHKENVRKYLDTAFEYFGHDIVLAHGKDIRDSDGIDFCGTGDGIVDFEYMARLMEKSGFSGDMVLHGIYDEDKMVGAREYWERCIGR